MATGEVALPTPTRLERLQAWARDDWRGQRGLLWGALLALLTTLAVILYYHATPAIVRDPDTPGYLGVAHALTHSGPPVNAGRLPGYPLLIVAVSLFACGGTLAALGGVQAALFILAILGVYILGYLILRRAWLAFIPAALAGTNINILSFVKPVLTEGLTLALVTALALAVLWWERAPSPRRLWLVALALVATFMTRPEWVYLPLPLMAALALVAWRRGEPGQLRRTLTHGAIATLALYALVGVYVLANGHVNGYYGFSDIQAFNLLGKVLQYHLVGGAPASYAEIDHAMSGYLARGVDNPWTIQREYEPFQRQHFKLMSGYASAMIARHPIAFALGCWDTLLRSLSSTEVFRPLTATASGVLLALAALSRLTLSWMWPVVLIAPAWWLLWGLGRGGRRSTQMSLIALLVAYDLFMTTVGGYIYYARLHTTFDPLLILVVVGSALLALERGMQFARGRLRAAR